MNEMTLGEWLDNWYTLYAKPFLKTSTLVSYNGYIEKHIKPFIGAVKLSDLNGIILQEFFNEKYVSGRLDNTGGLSEKTVLNIRQMLHAALRKALENGFISANYVEHVRLQKVSIPDMRVLSVEEQQRLITDLEIHKDEYSIGFILLLATGIRVGELCALKWSNIDFLRKIIKIRHTLQRLIPYYYVIQDENWFSIMHYYDRINECTLYYTINRKKSFDDCIRDSLLSLEDGEALYNYYLTLSPDTEPQYYGMHQVGISPVYYGYLDLLEKGYILHGFGYEMKEWNEADCDFNLNDKEHSGMSIIQNSGSNVYAMVSGEITDIGENFIVFHGFAKQRDIYLDPVIVYVNVNTAGLSVGQEFKKGQVITHTNNKRQEMQYKKNLSPPFFDQGFVSLINNNTGYDYLNITIFDFMDYQKSVIDPEIILSLANNN